MKIIKRLFWMFLLLCELMVGPLAIILWGWKYYDRALRNTIKKLQ